MEYVPKNCFLCRDELLEKFIESDKKFYEKLGLPWTREEAIWRANERPREAKIFKIVVKKGFPLNKKIEVCSRCRAFIFAAYNKEEYREVIGEKLPQNLELSYDPNFDSTWSMVGPTEGDKLLSKFAITIDDFQDNEKLKNIIEKERKRQKKLSIEEQEETRRLKNSLEQLEVEKQQRKVQMLKKLEGKIIELLKEKAVKMPASDIDAFLKHQDVDEIKELCEQMYHDGEISRTANYRYFILSEEKKEPKKDSTPKSDEVDIEKELEKLKGLLDKGLITQEQYDAKSNELLGL